MEKIGSGTRVPSRDMGHLIGLVLGLAVVWGYEALPSWWNSQPKTCYQSSDFGTSRIDLTRRVMLGEGVQNVQLNSNFFNGDRQLPISNFDPACPSTTLVITYNHDRRQMVLGMFLGTNPNLPPSLATGTSLNVEPNRQHRISAIWSDWQVRGLIIDGTPVADFRPVSLPITP